jgi:ribosomal protein L11 methyltransferase
MQYVKVTFLVPGQDISDMLTAILAEAGYDGFEESEGRLFAYIGQSKFNADEVAEIAVQAGVSHETEIVAQQNWNALWESNFPPVIVEDFCTIRAHFHDIVVTTPYEIQITPKMSFGTGHHSTTQLMMLMMRDIDFNGKSVLDFGTGTGVLAILAEMLGAQKILAIDNDEWCVENAVENAERNNCEQITVKIGSLENFVEEGADIILANINRHILLQYMKDLYRKLPPGGTLLMSGLLAEDKDIITDAAVAIGFEFKELREQLNWIALKFEKL